MKNNFKERILNYFGYIYNEENDWWASMKNNSKISHQLIEDSTDKKLCLIIKKLNIKRKKMKLIHKTEEGQYIEPGLNYLWNYYNKPRIILCIPLYYIKIHLYFRKRRRGIIFEISWITRNEILTNKKVWE